jgi:zinc transport system substrate-binding protein
MSKDVNKLITILIFGLDPFAMRVIAKNIYEALIELDNNKKDFYKENYERFLDEIDDTFLKIKQKINGSEITTYLCI